MISKASARFIRISARKCRLVADMVRGKPIDKAQAILMDVGKRAAYYIGQVLNAAVANAKKNPDLPVSDLYISKMTIDGGPMFKRYRAGSMGRAMEIKHRTSHILIELDLKKKQSPAAGHQPPVKENKKNAVAGKKSVTSDRKPAAKKVKKEATTKRGK